MTVSNVVEKHELETANSLRQKFAELTHQYGQLAWARRTLDKERVLLEDQFDELTKEESTFMNDLNKKYGTGILDVETGEFTPAPPA